MEIKDLADELKVGVTAIKRVLKEDGYLRADRTFRGAEFSLTYEEEQAVRAAHTAGRLARNRGATTDVTASEDADPEITSEDLDDLDVVDPRPSSEAPRGAVPHPIYVHQDLIAWSEDSKTPVELKKIYSRRMQELMAHGAATQMKNTRGKNQGWLRIALGGNHGSQYYLWVVNHGEPVRDQGEASSALFGATEHGSRFLRLARHHDETKNVLDVGNLDEYLPFDPSCVGKATCDGLSDPLVERQRAIVDDTATVRMIIGRPGSGKTTSLQAAAIRLHGRALYVTWSSVLAERATEWFRAYAPANLEVDVMTFRAFVAKIDPSRPMPAELSLPTTVAALKPIAEPLLPRGPWRSKGELRIEELYAELHAHFVGGALPVAFDERSASHRPSMSSDDYAKRRQQLGDDAIADVLRVGKKLMEADKLGDLFSAPVEAFERAHALQTGSLRLPPAFAYDWILVDEVQDLTLAEQWLLIDVAARSGRARGVLPGLLIAGDEAQTVRPTAFEFAPLSRMVHGRLGTRPKYEEHSLDENLRSPETIARVVEAADTTLYRLLPRGERPRGNRGASPADVTVGRVCEVHVTTQSELRSVLEAFKDAAGDASLVYPGIVVPERLQGLAADVGATLWTSETIKGLEFRSVGVLDVPETVRRTTDLAQSTHLHKLAGEFARTYVDRLLVALSRSTENLALIGAAWTDDCIPLNAIRATSKPATGDAATGDLRDGFLGPVAVHDLAEFLDLDGTDTLGRIDALLTSSARLLDVGQLEDAHREAENARGLLGIAGRPGSAGKQVRVRTHRQFATVLVATGLASGNLAELRRAARAFHDADDTDSGAFITSLVGALEKSHEETATCERLRDVGLGLTNFVERNSAVGARVAERIRARAAEIAASNKTPTTPTGRGALANALDILANSAPSDRAAYREAHQKMVAVALETIVAKTDKTHAAEYADFRRQLRDVEAGAIFDARHAEARGDLVDARRRWESCGRPKDALRCARAGTDFTEAARLAGVTEDADVDLLTWATELESLLARRPAVGHLLEPERDVLQGKATRALAATVAPKTAAKRR